MRKKIFAIILSAMMVVAFMPSLAFAAGSNQTVNYGHKFDDESIAFEGGCKVGFNIVKYQCSKEKYGVQCEAAEYGIEKVKHSWDKDSEEDHKAGYPKVDYDELTFDEVLDVMLEAGAPEEKVKSFQEDAQKGWCYYTVAKCTDCGKYLLEDLIETGVTDEGKYKEACIGVCHEWINNAPACADKTVCNRCGVEVKNIYKDAKHQPGNWQNAGTTCEGYKIQENYCKECGQLVETKCIDKDGKDQVKPNYAKHNFGEGMTEEEAKAEYGWKWYKNYVAKIGDKYYAPNEVEVAPGCETPGTGIFVCEDCGLTYENRSGKVTREIRKTGHEITEKSGEANCWHGAYTYNGCANEGCHFMRDFRWTSKPLKHDYKEVQLVKRGCEHFGITVFQCADCGFYAPVVKMNDKAGTFDSKWSRNPVEYAETIKCGHSYGEAQVVVKPTCLEKGVEGFVCENCGNAAVHDPYHPLTEIDATGHNYVDKEEAATCEEAGKTWKECENCGDVIDEKVVEALGHMITPASDVVEDVKATCTEDGYVTFKCDNCDYEETYFGAEADEFTGKEAPYYEALGHQVPDVWYEMMPPTYFEAGTLAKVCSECGEVVQEQATPFKIVHTKGVKAAKKSAVVNVKAIDGAVKYQIAVKQAGKAVYKVKAKVGKNTVKNLKSGKKYKFKVIVFNEDGVKNMSPWSRVIVVK